MCPLLLSTFFCLYFCVYFLSFLGGERCLRSLLTDNRFKAELSTPTLGCCSGQGSSKWCQAVRMIGKSLIRTKGFRFRCGRWCTSHTSQLCCSGLGVCVEGPSSPWCIWGKNSFSNGFLDQRNCFLEVFSHQMIALEYKVGEGSYVVDELFHFELCLLLKAELEKFALKQRPFSCVHFCLTTFIIANSTLLLLYLFQVCFHV